MEHLTAFSQSTVPKFAIPKLTQLSLVALALTAGSSLLSQTASAHGYVISPESRSYACKTGSNVNCGAIQWEPQSVEGPSGFPESGPADGKIASAASAISKRVGMTFLGSLLLTTLPAIGVTI